MKVKFLFWESVSPYDGDEWTAFASKLGELVKDGGFLIDQKANLEVVREGCTTTVLKDDIAVASYECYSEGNDDNGTYHSPCVVIEEVDVPLGVELVF